MKLLDIIIYILIIIIIFVYIKNNCSNENFADNSDKNQIEPPTVKRNINLSLNKSIKKECKNGFCYYDINKLLRKNNQQLSGNFELNQDHGHSVSITGGPTPILFNKGIKFNVRATKDKVYYDINILK